jgi:hypothetical protein
MPLTFTLGGRCCDEDAAKFYFNTPSSSGELLSEATHLRIHSCASFSYDTRRVHFLIPIQVSRGEYAPFSHKHQHGHVKSQLSGDEISGPGWPVHLLRLGR